MKKQAKIGLALSGGGARGIAHIGVIRALEENNIPIHCISGASAGSIIGALYSAGQSVEQMTEFVKDSSLLKAYEIGLPTKGLTSLNYLKKRLSEYIERDNFDVLKIPLYIGVSNLNSGEYEIISKGTLFDAIMASSAIPFVFKPIKINDYLYVDGGLLNNMPIDNLIIEENVDYLIGVNVMPNVATKNENLESVIGTVTRSIELSIWNNSQASIAQCDVLIEPEKLSEYHIFNFNKAEQIIQVGYEAALEKVGAIKANFS